MKMATHQSLHHYVITSLRHYIITSVRNYVTTLRHQKLLLVTSPKVVFKDIATT